MPLLVPIETKSRLDGTKSLDWPRLDRERASGAFLLGVLICWLYWGVGLKLVHDWSTLPDFSHGFLVPFFVAYLLWDKRTRIQATQVHPTWAGTSAVSGAVFLLLAGVYGADLFLTRLSFVILMTGLVWTFAGPAMLRTLRLPLAGMLLAVPLPAILFNQLTVPLQFLAATIASNILPLADVPVLREGNMIQLPAMQLEVAEACSGIRSLLTLFTCAVMFGYLVEGSPQRRAILMLASVPIAVIANVLRIVGTGLFVQYWDPAKALGFFHEFSGWLMFVISLVCLGGLHTLMQRFLPQRLAIQ